MKLLDTNFISSLFNPDDVNHTRAKEIMFSISDEEKVRVPYVVGAELSISEDGEKYLYAARQITSKFVSNSEQDLDYIINLPAKSRAKLKANDCLLLALCKRLNAEILTFDKVLLKIQESLG